MPYSGGYNRHALAVCFFHFTGRAPYTTKLLNHTVCAALRGAGYSTTMWLQLLDPTPQTGDAGLWADFLVFGTEVLPDYSVVLVITCPTAPFSSLSAQLRREPRAAGKVQKIHNNQIRLIGGCAYISYRTQILWSLLSMLSPLLAADPDFHPWHPTFVYRAYLVRSGGAGGEGKGEKLPRFKLQKSVPNRTFSLACPLKSPLGFESIHVLKARSLVLLPSIDVY